MTPTGTPQALVLTWLPGATNPPKVMKDASHLMLHLTLLPTPRGIKLLRVPSGISETILQRFVTVAHTFSVSPMSFLPLLFHSYSLTA